MQFGQLKPLWKKSPIDFVSPYMNSLNTYSCHTCTNVSLVDLGSDICGSDHFGNEFGFGSRRRFCTPHCDIPLSMVLNLNSFSPKSAPRRPLKICRPNSVCLGKLPGTDFYKEINAYSQAEEIPGVKVYRFDCNLYFANVETFRLELYK